MVPAARVLTLFALATTAASQNNNATSLRLTQALDEALHTLHQKAKLVFSDATPYRNSASFLHYVNNRAGNHSLRADLHSTAFISFCKAFSKDPSMLLNNNITFEDNEVCTKPTFTCSGDNYKFRTHDGTCNNLRNLGGGRANSGLLRLLPANYNDGMYKVRRSKSGHPLPSARYCQNHAFGEKRISSHHFTLFLMQWGQMVSHDLSLATTQQTVSGPIQCCKSDGSAPLPPTEFSSACYSISIPENDPAYKRYKLLCMEFDRAMTVAPDDCKPQPAIPMNVVTAHLDLSQVYGNSDTVNEGLRAGTGGRLAVSNFSHGEFLPLSPDSPLPCVSQNGSDSVCFTGGDVRINQNPLLTAMHVLFLRKHNTVAGILAHINPHWNDERIYQETRRILVACYQHITYKEMLQVFIGTKLYEKHFKSYTYDEKLSPGTYVEFTSVAYRYFHTLVQGILKLLAASRNIEKELVLSDYFNNPTIVTVKFEDLLIGGVTQECRKEDKNFDREISDQLFRPNKTTFGLSLTSFDIQRARDHGVPPYNDLREKCGLTRAINFADLSDTMSPESVKILKKVYRHVDDIDAIVGGALEKHVPGALMGRTFLCLMVKQFQLSQRADRFFYLNEHQKYPFSKSQLKEIKKANVARLICDYTKVEKIQKKAFLKISEKNPLVPCSEIPSIDLSKWKEH